MNVSATSTTITTNISTATATATAVAETKPVLPMTMRENSSINGKNMGQQIKLCYQHQLLQEDPYKDQSYNFNASPDLSYLMTIAKTKAKAVNGTSTSTTAPALASASALERVERTKSVTSMKAWKDLLT